MIARVTGFTATNQYAKAGLMIRSSAAASATNAVIEVTLVQATPNQGLSFRHAL